MLTYMFKLKFISNKTLIQKVKLIEIEELEDRVDS